MKTQIGESFVVHTYVDLQGDWRTELRENDIVKVGLTVAHAEWEVAARYHCQVIQYVSSHWNPVDNNEEIAK